MTSSRVTIVIVTYNSADVLGRCLASIQTHAPDTPTIVVDNASSDTSVEIARAAPFVTLLRSEENHGFSKANNRALRTVETEFALLLNPDACLTSSTLSELVAAADRHVSSAALGPKTLYDDGRPQLSFGSDLTLRSEYRQRKLVRGLRAGEAWAIQAAQEATLQEREVDWVSGSCMLLRMSHARAAGFFDERYFLYEEDADLCLRLRKAGGKVLLIPKAVISHGLGTSMDKSPARARKAYEESHRLYYALHRGPAERFLLRALLTVRTLSRRPG